MSDDWKPCDEEDRFEIERLEDGQWHPTAFVDIKPGDIFRAKHAGAWVDPMTLEYVAAPMQAMCLEAPFKNRETGSGWVFAAQYVDATAVRQ